MTSLLIGSQMLPHMTEPVLVAYSLAYKYIYWTAGGRMLQAQHFLKINFTVWHVAKSL